MIFLKKTRATETRDRLIAEARSHLGYRTRPGGVSDFGATVGYSSHDIPWDGAFIDVVARSAGASIPACVNTLSGLAEFQYSGRLYSTPEIGDIVFYSFSVRSENPWGQPHVGIVTGLVGDFVQTGRFVAIEAQTGSGLVRDIADRNGIFERVRWRYETIGFGRPNYGARKPRPGIGPNLQTDNLFVRISRVRPGKRNADVQTVQAALALVADLRDYEPGVYCPSTRDALARWQRMIGRVGSDASGEPDFLSLERLGRESGLFEMREI